jgi:hypothetical protein
MAIHLFTCSRGNTPVRVAIHPFAWQYTRSHGNTPVRIHLFICICMRSSSPNVLRLHCIYVYCLAFTETPPAHFALHQRCLSPRALLFLAGSTEKQNLSKTIPSDLPQVPLFQHLRQEVHWLSRALSHASTGIDCTVDIAVFGGPSAA